MEQQFGVLEGRPVPHHFFLDVADTGVGGQSRADEDDSGEVKMWRKTDVGEDEEGQPEAH